MVMYKDFITFGEVCSNDYDALIVAKEIDKVPHRKVERISIPGRNGELVIDSNAYENVDISYTFFIRDKVKARQFMSALYALEGYQRLEDSEYPEEYRMAMITSDASVTRLGYDHGNQTVTITMTAKPQRWLKLGEQKITLENTTNISRSYLVFNPTLMASKPLIWCEKAVRFEIRVTRRSSINHKYFETLEDEIYMDSELMDSRDGVKTNGYYGNKNNKVKLDYGYAELVSGESEFILPVNSGRIVIYPRWWRL